MPGDVLQNAPVVGMKKRFPRSFGRYVLEKSLSRGGMGEVFSAIAKGVRQRCVIKTIRGDLHGDEEFIGRFADEAKIMVRIHHENIIRVFDAGKVDADYYIAMEYVHGRDLGDVLDRAYERGEPMPLQLGLYISSCLLDGLDYAHGLTDEHGRHMGLVHRDISPQNVLIGFDGSVKLIDFGLARTDVLPSRTQGALAVGKYGYMSPEQARHERIDGRADIYSTGVMLFEVFTGDRLVDEQDQATLWQRVLTPRHRSPRSVLPGLPREIDDLVMTAVAVRPEERYRDAGEMLRAVERIRSPEGNREALVRYLRYLYPKVDFGAPPLPAFEEIPDNHEEKSIIFAVSREGALSVFGRGDLAIEFTRQFDAAQVRDSLRRRRENDRGAELRSDGERPTAAIETASVEQTFVRRAEELPPPPASSEGATKVAPYPEPPPGTPITTEETRFMRPGTPARDFRDGAPESTIQAAPVLNLPTSAQPYRDDEMTVMMSAPPRNLVARVPEPIGEDGGDAPTRLSRTTGADDTSPPVTVLTTGNSGAAPVVAATRGRAIREKNLRHDPSERGPREREDRPRPPAEDRGRKIAVHRATVGTQGIASAAAPAPPKPERSFAAATEATLSEEGRQPAAWLLPALIVLGALCVAALLALLLLG